MLTSYRFTGPSRRATRKGTCPTCGKPSTRTRTFERTVSPFNKNPDGTVKTWAEVAADVRAAAEVWQPEPEVFEHDKCLAARLAPEPARRVGMDPERAAKTDRLRQALLAVAAFTKQHGLPLTRVEVGPDWGRGNKWVAESAFVPTGEIVIWARAFGLETVQVEDGGHCTYVRVNHETPELSWRVHAYVRKPSVGDRLGDAPIDWGRDRNGRRTKRGTVAVRDLEAGLLRMGITVTAGESR